MKKQPYTGPLERVNDTLWRIPRSYKAGMQVDGLIYVNDGFDPEGDLSAVRPGTFHQVEITNRPPCFVQSLARRIDWANAHDRRVETGSSV